VRAAYEALADQLADCLGEQLMGFIDENVFDHLVRYVPKITSDARRDGYEAGRKAQAKGNDDV
jgi:hypothetical protein